ncbi:MAG: Rrf2 family transcriptional regulator [Bacteroidia bacterium]|nr:Rrf2 family transcriptional regulator [Bacteroidia bacterium]MCF8446323.1 Rrf2 family transcriptional regulator [Bacteroidia bacterium]
MFSKTCEYAIRSVIIICQHSKEGNKTNVKEISKLAEVPEQYIAKILQTLTKAQIVGSIKGPGGGFFIDPSKEKIKLIEVVKAIDGESLFTACGLGLKECSEKNPCPLHTNFKTIRNNIKKMLADTTIEDLSDKLSESLFKRK